MEELPEAFKIYRAGREIDEVECIVPDLAGMSRGKAMRCASSSAARDARAVSISTRPLPVRM
jgi:hypothetical protein